MKLPRFDPRSAGDFLLHHGEKLVAAVVALVALLLVWQGVDAVRTLSVTEAQTPDAVERAATQARGHIDREANPPADLLPPRPPLADMIDPWRTPLVPWKSGTIPGLTVADAPVVAVLDNPLFDELAKRGRPDVLPVEDLHAVAGIAVLPVVAAGPAGPIGPPPMKPKKPDAGRRTGRAGDPLAGGADASAAPAEAAARATGRIVPYTVVTGLIPVAKQQEEYRQRFESCGYRDPRRDSPLWCDFEIDRGTVGPDGRESWVPLDLAAIAGRRPAGPGEVAAVPPEFLLTASEEKRSRSSTPLEFCAPLPPRIDGTWELADLHPWVVKHLADGLDQADRPADQAPAAATEPGREGPGFGAGEERPTERPAPQATARLADYRMFRFIDTDVRPGTAYRYRVRLKVWNPNFDSNPERMRPHLKDPELARELKLASPNSAASAATVVPDTTRILVAPLRREDLKDLKIRPRAATVEVLVMAPAEAVGSFTLRALVADPGALIDVDDKLNMKNQRDRARGDKIETGRLLVDTRGRQLDRLDGPADDEKQPGGIPEPFDVICLRPDGSFEVASVADSERLVAAYADTLPARKSDPRESGTPAGQPADPLARQGAGR